MLWKMIIPAPLREPYDIKQLGLGTQSTVVIALSTDCKSCLDSLDFYQSLVKLPEVDGQKRKVIGVAMDGVAPMHDLVTPRGFKPHLLTSGPYMFRSLPGVSQPGTILLLNADGQQMRKWVGVLSEAQRREIVEAIQKS